MDTRTRMATLRFMLKGRFEVSFCVVMRDADLLI